MRKKEQAERAETEESLLEFEAQNEALKKSIEKLQNENAQFQNEIAQLQKDKAELNARLSDNNGRLIIAIDNKAKGIFETWCETYEKEMPENYRENQERFKHLGFEPNRYNMPILANVMAFLGYGSTDFAELTRKNIEQGAKRYQTNEVRE